MPVTDFGLEAVVIFNERSFRVVWSAPRGDWIVAPEFARGKCKCASRQAFDYPLNSNSCRANDKPAFLMPKQCLLSVLVGICFVALPSVTAAQSLILDKVAHGEVSIQIGSQSTVTQTNNKAIIDWRNLSVGQGDSLSFVQPSSAAIALNRITGSSVSQIDGLLSANGQVWILNPNGVMIGKTGQINAAGFLA